MLLVRYDAARRALAEAKRVDEVKDIRDKAIAVNAYGKQAKDKRLVAMATEIRKRAERRLGQLLAEIPKAKPPGGSKTRPRKDRVSKKPDLATLDKLSIDKNLADRARKSAALTEPKFEANLTKAVRLAVASTEGTASVISEARAGKFRSLDVVNSP